MSWAGVDICVFAESCFLLIPWPGLLTPPCFSHLSFLHSGLWSLVSLHSQMQVSAASATAVSPHILHFFLPLSWPFLSNKPAPPKQIFFHCAACFSRTLHLLSRVTSGLVWPGSCWCLLWDTWQRDCAFHSFLGHHYILAPDISVVWTSTLCFKRKPLLKISVTAGHGETFILHVGVLWGASFQHTSSYSQDHGAFGWMVWSAPKKMLWRRWRWALSCGWWWKRLFKAKDLTGEGKNRSTPALSGLRASFNSWVLSSSNVSSLAFVQLREILSKPLTLPQPLNWTWRGSEMPSIRRPWKGRICK